jgi:hypothetical protein
MNLKKWSWLWRIFISFSLKLVVRQKMHGSALGLVVLTKNTHILRLKSVQMRVSWLNLSLWPDGEKSSLECLQPYYHSLDAAMLITRPTAPLVCQNYPQAALEMTAFKTSKRCV